ncbi:hypothetical protein NitYY0826_C1615 [Nitratiruptor sp. YY08-26]|uniref:hypothetical protein n=1 Tax=unclassified Nitratiruptor TaxID=2624044 RepID=UPI0019156006|nr:MULTISPECIES: hypothetical protein [unclassified Nitratiruptor]BCD62732.1 hypothetical protein NitYY0813_C1613 [Nitratiruptor sp. YY08-13]BCD66668.1 hypothetical protein NitYY0826_C1615 [Nitratiruptor sp. YY08-26]
MNEVIIYVFVLAIFEFYESSWQSGTTLQEVTNNLYTKYQKGLFYFFFSHPSFIYALYLGIKYDLTNFWFLTILFFKFLNISFELVVIQKLQEQKLHEILPIPLDMKIERWMSYINVVLFPLLLFIAFMQTA